MPLRIHQDYAALTACRPADSPACQQLSNYLNTTEWHQAQGIHLAVLAAPLLLAMFAGPPVLARELQDGTFRYAWTQGIGRVRATVAKVAFLGMLTRRVLPAMAATLSVYAALAAATVLSLQKHYPVSTFWPMQLFESGWLLLLSALLIAGTVSKPFIRTGA